MIHNFQPTARRAYCWIIKALVFTILVGAPAASAQGLSPPTDRILQSVDGIAYLGPLADRPACRPGMTARQSEAILNDAWLLTRAAIAERFQDQDRGRFFAMSAIRLAFCVAAASNPSAAKASNVQLFVAQQADFAQLGIFQPNDLLNILLDYEPGLEDFSHRGHYTVLGEFDDQGRAVRIRHRAQPDGFSVFGRIPDWREKIEQPDIPTDWQERSLTLSDVNRFRQSPGVLELTRKTDVSALGSIILAAKLAQAAGLLAGKKQQADLLHLSVADALVDASQHSIEMAAKPIEFGPPVNLAFRISKNRYNNDPTDPTRKHMAARFAVAYPLMIYRFGFFSDAARQYQAVIADPPDENARAAAQFGLAMSHLGNRNWGAACRALAEFIDAWGDQPATELKLLVALELADLLEHSGAPGPACRDLRQVVAGVDLDVLADRPPQVIENILFAMSADLRWLRNPAFVMPLMKKWISIGRTKGYRRVELKALRELSAYIRDLFYQISFVWRNNRWVERSGSYIEFPHNLECPLNSGVARDGLDAALVCDIRSFSDFERMQTNPGDVVLLPHLPAYSRHDPEEDAATSFAVYLGMNVSPEPMMWIEGALTQTPRNVRPLLKMVVLDWFFLSFEALKSASASPNKFIYRPAGRIKFTLLRDNITDFTPEEKEIALTLIDARSFLEKWYPVRSR